MLSVPSTYGEPKGIFLLEAMANGVPVVQPRHGSFPEIVRKTGGGMLVEPDSTGSLAEGILSLWKDRALAESLAGAAPQAFASITASPAWRPARSMFTPGSPPRASMLEVSNIAKEYPTPRGPLTILSGVTLSLQRGDSAAIMGPSGSGKSTLLYILGALEPPTSGNVTLDGRDPFELAEKELAAFRNQSIGFIFQDHCLLPQCSVLENVLIPTLVAADRCGLPGSRAHAARAGRAERSAGSSPCRAFGRRKATRCAGPRADP